MICYQHLSWKTCIYIQTSAPTHNESSKNLKHTLLRVFLKIMPYVFMLSHAFNKSHIGIFLWNFGCISRQNVGQDFSKFQHLGPLPLAYYIWNLGWVGWLASLCETAKQNNDLTRKGSMLDSMTTQSTAGGIQILSTCFCVLLAIAMCSWCLWYNG